MTPTLDAYGHLWMAVLRQAIDDATIKSSTTTTADESRVVRFRARMWLKDADDFVGSLRWICNILGLDPQRILTEYERRTKEDGLRKRKHLPTYSVKRKPA
jgi:hypothetical protein